MFGNCNKGTGGGHIGRLKTIRYKWAVVSVITNNVTDVHENPCVKRGKRDSVGRLYFFLQKVTHAVWALDKPFILFRSWRPTCIYML